MIYTNDTSVSTLLDNGIISVRTYNILMNARLETLGAVLRWLSGGGSPTTLRNAGRKTATEIYAVVHLPVYDAPTIERTVWNYDSIDARFAALVDAEASALGAEPQALLALIRDFDGKFAIPAGKKAGEVVHRRQEIADAVARMAGRLSAMEGLAIPAEQMRTRAVAMRGAVALTAAEEVGLVSPCGRAYLEAVVRRLAAKHLTGRSQAVVRNLDIGRLVALFDHRVEDYETFCHGKYMFKTMNSLYRLNREFAAEFRRVGALTEAEVSREYYLMTYPFLDDYDTEFISRFERRHNRLPAFRLLYRYIMTSPDRHDIIFRLYHGLGGGRAESGAEIGRRFGLSSERIRQIATETSRGARGLIERLGGARYDALAQADAVTADSPLFREIVGEEMPGMAFATFARLAALLTPLRAVTAGGATLLVSARLAAAVDYKEMARRLEAAASRRRSRQAEAGVAAFVPEGLPAPLSDAAAEIALYLASRVYGLEVEHDRIIAGQSHVDVMLELTEILREKGEPMSLNELYAAFAARFPGHRAADRDKLRSYIFRSAGIRSLGNRSVYGLAEWTHVYFGSIKDFIIDTLSASAEPVAIHEIYRRAVKIFPATNSNSINTSIVGDDKQRFVIFEGGLAGLRDREYPPQFVESSRTPHGFDERLAMLREFIDTNRHLPVYNNDPHQKGLCHWLYNVSNGIIETTAGQRAQLDALLADARAKHYPATGKEYNFLEKCRRYREFVATRGKRPTNADGKALASWMERARRSVDKWTDQRPRYLAELLADLDSRRPLK